MGTDSREPWVIALGAACIAAVGLGLVWRLRSVRPAPAGPAALALATTQTEVRHDA